MNVSLTPKLEELVQQKVGSGLYNSASEVIREALRLLEERDRLREIRLSELRQEIVAGLDQADRGMVLDYDDTSLTSLAEEIKAKGRKRMSQQLIK